MTDSILATALEAFINFMNDQTCHGLRLISMKSILFVLTLPDVSKLPNNV